MSWLQRLALGPGRPAAMAGANPTPKIPQARPAVAAGPGLAGLAPAVPPGLAQGPGTPAWLADQLGLAVLFLAAIVQSWVIPRARAATLARALGLALGLEALLRHPGRAGDVDPLRRRGLGPGLPRPVPTAVLGQPGFPGRMAGPAVARWPWPGPAQRSAGRILGGGLDGILALGRGRRAADPGPGRLAGRAWPGWPWRRGACGRAAGSGWPRPGSALAAALGLGWGLANTRRTRAAGRSRGILRSDAWQSRSPG